MAAFFRQRIRGLQAFPTHVHACSKLPKANERNGLIARLQASIAPQHMAQAPEVSLICFEPLFKWEMEIEMRSARFFWCLGQEWRPPLTQTTQPLAWGHIQRAVFWLALFQMRSRVSLARGVSCLAKSRAASLAVPAVSLGRFSSGRLGKDACGCFPDNPIAIFRGGWILLFSPIATTHHDCSTHQR